MLIHRYLARRYTLWFAATSAGLGLASTLLDWANLISLLPKASLGQTLGLALLSAPGTLYKVLPLMMLLSAAGLFVALSRSSEGTVARGAGLSTMRLLLGPAAAALAISLLALVMFNPLVASTTKAYNQRFAALSDEATQAFANRSEQLWLRQSTREGQTVITGLNVNSKGTMLRLPSFVGFGADGLPARRIIAQSAELREGAWLLRDAKIWHLQDPNPEASAALHARFTLPSNLTEAGIQDGFGAPHSVPIWQLPSFIKNLQDSGFSALRHRAWLASELARPVFLLAMMLIGAAFMLRHFRAGGVGLMALAAVGSGFALYFLRQMALTMGQSGQLPVLLAAWVPALAALLLALGLILHREDL